MITLREPTKEERETPVLQLSSFNFFPHALVESPLSSPDHAIFRIEHEGHCMTTYMAISVNEGISPFDNTWREVFEDFLVFARTNSLTLAGCVGMAFFKNGPRDYRSESIGSSRDLRVYEKGGEINITHEKPFSNDRHPELKPGEMFLCNTGEEGFDGFLWETKRRGDISYNIYGDPINDKKGYYPIFIQIIEAERRGINKLKCLQPAA